MCGLNFYLAKRDNHQLKKWIKDSREHIESRGPDNYSELFLESDKIGFSHSRLAIVDLDERSNQPFKYKDYILLFNGEIYNFLKIKRELVNLGYSFKTTSDTEVLIIGYHHFKDEIFEKIDGMFAFVIYDSVSKSVIFGRDKNAEKPMYMFNNSQKLAISSNFLALTEFSDLSKENLAENLKYGFSLMDRTIYKNILCLLPGVIYKFEILKDECVSAPILSMKKSIKCNIKKSLGDSAKQLGSLIETSLSQTIHADVPVGLLFSGGVDSTILL